MSGVKTNMKKLLLSLICGQLLFSCNKDETPGICQTLQNGVLNNDIAKTEVAINSFINQLRNKIYSEANLTALVKKISSQCAVICEILCFDCIKTLPSQSEIRIEINSGGSLVVRTIDISYSNTHTMTFRDMHN